MQGDFDNIFEHPLCGFARAGDDGRIQQINSTVSAWTGISEIDIRGKLFSDMLTIGGKIYYETHLRPLLHMQGHFDEIALELVCKDGKKMEVLVNAFQTPAVDTAPQYTLYTIFKATDRRQYEKNLREAWTKSEMKFFAEQANVSLREQFIAILGHDLRNPLGAVMAAANLLAESDLTERDTRLVDMIKRSGVRMRELIENIMDFARTRLGGGLILDTKPVWLQPILAHVADELKTSYMSRTIVTEFSITQAVTCDPNRVSQLLSNLLANALTHGAVDSPVHVRAFTKDNIFEMSVSNSGPSIPCELFDELFKPFSRNKIRPSQNGLGLGLYIASEIARAHNGKLECTSTDEETRFTLRMPV